jgi:broad specificity phosphatase PhoE
MTLLGVIRHAATAWSEVGRLQGRSDPPLSPRGIACARDWRLPSELAGCRLLSSPLRRAVETARLFGCGEPALEPRLVEMAWGEWEGCRLAELRARLGERMTEDEARGLDFEPPGGESPRAVQLRLAPLLAEIARTGEPVAAVTHKGVVRALYALAAGWDMHTQPPCRLDWSAAHLFRLDPWGRPSVERLNVPLNRREAKQSCVIK